MADIIGIKSRSDLSDEFVIDLLSKCNPQFTRIESSGEFAYQRISSKKGDRIIVFVNSIQDNIGYIVYGSKGTNISRVFTTMNKNERVFSIPVKNLDENFTIMIFSITTPANVEKGYNEYFNNFRYFHIPGLNTNGNSFTGSSLQAINM